MEGSAGNATPTLVTLLIPADELTEIDSLASKGAGVRLGMPAARQRWILITPYRVDYLHEQSQACQFSDGRDVGFEWEPRPDELDPSELDLERSFMLGGSDEDVIARAVPATPLTTAGSQCRLRNWIPRSWMSSAGSATDRQYAIRSTSSRATESLRRS